jgi:hypothetical protein
MMRRIVAGWYHRGIFALCRKSLVRGIEVAVFAPQLDDSVERLAARLDAALAILQAHHPRAYADLRELLPCVLVTTLVGAGQCVPQRRLCMLDESTLLSEVGTPERLAAVLVHEIMHARLWRAGFPYTSENQIRIERICVRAELLLASRMPNGEALVPELNQQITSAETLWSTANHRAVSLQKLRALDVPEWLVRVVDWTSSRRRRRTNRSSALLLLLALPASLEAQDHRSTGDAASDSAAVVSALDRFLTAFENLEWEPFRAAFSDSATVFHPSPSTPERVTGRATIDSTFRAVFADVRAHAADGPPYHRLSPVDLRIQPLAPGIVLATFELRNTERLGRRTVVFRREGDVWRIVHLHASNLPPTSSALPGSP